MATRSIPGTSPSKKGSPRSFTPKPAGPTVVRRGKMYRSGDTYRADLGGGRSMFRKGDTYRYEDAEGNEVVRKDGIIRTGKKGKYKYSKVKPKNKFEKKNFPAPSVPKVGQGPKPKPNKKKPNIPNNKRTMFSNLKPEPDFEEEQTNAIQRRMKARRASAK